MQCWSYKIYGLLGGHLSIYLSIYSSIYCHSMVSKQLKAVKRRRAHRQGYLAICHVIRYPRVQTHQCVVRLAKREEPSWPCFACQVVFERKGFAREMVSNCDVGATTYTVCWVGTDRGAAPAFGHMPRHTIPTCPNASMCSEPSEARRAKLAMPRLSSGV